MSQTFTILIFISLSFITLASADSKNSFDLYTKLSEPEHTKLLEVKLKEKNIDYAKKEDGYIWYSSKNQTSVSLLTKNIITTDLPADRSINYAQPFSRDLFINQLKNKGIPFEVKIRHNINWIVWDKKYISDVNKIKKFVGIKTNEYITKQIQLELDKK